MFTEEQKQVAGKAFRDYENRIQMIWDDMLFELSLQLGLEDDEVEKLMEEVA